MPPWTTATYALKGVWLLFLALLFLAGIGFGAVQTVRLNGFGVWPFKIEGALAKVDRLEGEIQAILTAQREAERLARVEKLATEAAYRQVAERIDDAFENSNTAAVAAADRYIAANRMRCPATGSSAGGAAATAPHNGSGVPADLSADSLVLVRDADVRACAGAVTYGLKAREWALELEQASSERPTIMRPSLP